MLFNYYLRKQKNSSFYCNQCKLTHIGEAYDRIYRPPKILIIILDRGHGKTFKGKVEIKKNLDLQSFIVEENYEYKYSTKYELICVSSHRGSSSSNGHYTASCKTDNNKYYYFSDTYAKEINEEQLIRDEPYLLFYLRNENNMDSTNTKNIFKKRQTLTNNITFANNNKNIDFQEQNEIKDEIKL